MCAARQKLKQGFFREFLESGMAARALVVGGTSGIGRKIASTLFSREL